MLILSKLTILLCVVFFWDPWPKFEMFGGQRVCFSIGSGSALEFIQSGPPISNLSERTFVFKTFYNYLLLRFLDTITFDNQFRDFASYFGRQAKSGLEVFLFFSDCQIEP